MKNGVALLLNLLVFLHSSGQESTGIGIGTTNAHPSAAFEVADSSRGILIPRMTMAQRNAIQNPAEGLMVYQTDSTKGFWYWDGLGWNITSGKSSRDSSSGIRFSDIKIFSTPGFFTWTVPLGINSVSVELWGGGGGIGGNGGGYRLYTTGGWIYSSGGSGGSGGKGGYNKQFLNVSPGQVFTIKVGAGGTPGVNGAFGENSTAGSSGGSGGKGQQSSFDNVKAEGGFGGGGGTGGNNCCYNCACNGSAGVNGSDGLVINYDYPYTGFQHIRSYIPTSYIPAYPSQSSRGGNAQTPSGEDGLVIISMGK